MITGLPAGLRIGIVFCLILFAINKKMSLATAFFLGAVLLGLVFGMSVEEVAGAVSRALMDSKTLSLAVVVTLILILSHSMEDTGQMARLLDGFRGLIRSPRLNLILFPALIGLLPMPGGAVFSAPMVKAIGTDRGFSGAQLSYVNYWFRHIWEYWWPLYPGVLLATGLARIDFWIFVLFMFPLTLVALLAGYGPLAKIVPESAGPETAAGGSPGAFMRELTPVWIVILMGVGLGVLLSFLPLPKEIPAKETGLIIALLAGIGWVWGKNRLSAAARRDLLTKPALFKMFFMVAGILIFQGILNDSRAVTLLADELLRWRIPLMPVTVILPFIVGLTAGITIAFVGATFPILISLTEAYGEGHLILSYIMLAMVGGFVGVLLSPVHLCLLLSNGYFNTEFKPVYRYLWMPCASLLLAGSLYFLGLYHLIGG